MGNCFGRSDHKNRKESDRRKEAQKCSICWSPIVNPGLTNTCRHQFCFGCIDQWSEDHNQCPLCRRQYSSILFGFKSEDNYSEKAIGQRRRPQRVPGTAVRWPNGQRPQGLFHTIGTFGQIIVQSPESGLFMIYTTRMASDPTRIQVRLQYFAPNQTFHIYHYYQDMNLVLPEVLIESVMRLLSNRSNRQI